MSNINDDRANEWSLVLNNPEGNPSGLSCKRIYENLKGIYPFIAVILHDDDYNDDGSKKTEHYHLILKTKRVRKQTLIKSLSKILDIPENCISSKEIYNFRSAVRYITHIDYEDKTLYLVSDVLTNDRPYLNGFFKERIENISEEVLIEVVREEKTTSKILKRIGLELFKKYASVIRELQKEVIQ